MSEKVDWNEVPRIGQGTWEMEHDAEPVTALRRGLDLGTRHIDTAEMYGDGEVERLVGKAVAGRRDEVPPHGTLARVRQSIPSDKAAGPAMTDGATAPEWFQPAAEGGEGS